MERTLRFIFNDGTEKILDLTRAIKIDIQNGKYLFHVDLDKTGKGRITYEKHFINDLSKLERIEIVRREDSKDPRTEF